LIDEIRNNPDFEKHWGNASSKTANEALDGIHGVLKNTMNGVPHNPEKKKKIKEIKKETKEKI
jgi:hypothetical protein